MSINLQNLEQNMIFVFYNSQINRTLLQQESECHPLDILRLELEINCDS